MRPTRFASASGRRIGFHQRRQRIERFGVALRRGESESQRPAAAGIACAAQRCDRPLHLGPLARIGRKGQARDIFEVMLASRNPLGLLSEDTAFDNGEGWGNFPQTYSHVGLIIAAMRLSRSWQEAS